MFPGLFNTTAIIERDAALGTNGRTEKQVIYTNVPCLLMPMNITTAIEHEFSLGRAYDIYMNQGQDVQPGDRLTINGNSYMARVVQPYQVPLVGYTLARAEQEVA